MKKKFLSLAIVLIASMGMIVSAQCNKSKCVKDSAECKKELRCDKNMKPRAMCMFEGLNLTEDQKSKLEALKPDPEKMGKMKPEKFDKNNDPRKEYLNKVKEILTPEQYTQFLENCALSKNDHPRGDFRHDRRKLHHGKKMHRMKCDKDCENKDSIKK